jgi:NAD(P)-dependent dehydrogenase (short-subunit alcohol dehydrogenase family)
MEDPPTIVRRTALGAGLALAAAGPAAAGAQSPTPATVNSGVLARLFGLGGKVALVTGSGASGHPDVLAALLAAGATVVSADIGPIGYEILSQRAGAALERLSYLALDIGEEQSIKHCLDQVVTRHGRIDILVNAGGIYLNNRIADLSTADWEEIQKFDLTSTFFLMREAIRHMIATKTEGRIVNLTTVGARQTMRHGNSAYAAARAGVTMLGRTAAYDYAQHGIRVNTVLVGRVAGGGHVRRVGDVRILAAGGKVAPLGGGSDGRQPLPDGSLADVAAAVLYLVGPAGGYVTGQELAVDGGYYVS